MGTFLSAPIKRRASTLQRSTWNFENWSSLLFLCYPFNILPCFSVALYFLISVLSCCSITLFIRYPVSLLPYFSAALWLYYLISLLSLLCLTSFYIHVDALFMDSNMLLIFKYLFYFQDFHIYDGDIPNSAGYEMLTSCSFHWNIPYAKVSLTFILLKILKVLIILCCDKLRKLCSEIRTSFPKIA